MWDCGSSELLREQLSMAVLQYSVSEATIILSILGEQSLQAVTYIKLPKMHFFFLCHFLTKITQALIVALFLIGVA